MFIMIKAIIFDLWGTLFYEDVKGKHPFRLFAEKIGQNFDDYNYLKIFEKHLMLEKHYDLTVPVKLILMEFKIRATTKLVSELTYLLKKEGASQKPYQETFEVLNRLKENYLLGLITNTYYYAYKQLNEKFKTDSLFNVVLKSYETGILKPNPKNFEIMLKKLKVKKNEVLIVGDSLEDDVKAAEKFRIKGILIDRKNKYSSYENRICSLKELKKFL